MQYDELHEHDEDKMIVVNHLFYFPMNFLVDVDENKLQKQVLLNFLIQLDVHEQLLKIHNHKQFELDQMYTEEEYFNTKDFLMNLLFYLC